MKASKETKTKVLQFLSDHENAGYFYHKAYIAREVELPVPTVLIALRALKKEGLVYSETMFSEDDGLIAGTGWGITYGSDRSAYLAVTEPML